MKKKYQLEHLDATIINRCGRKSLLCKTTKHFNFFCTASLFFFYYFLLINDNQSYLGKNLENILLIRPSLILGTTNRKSEGRLLPYLCAAITPLYHRPRSATTVLMFCNRSTLPQAKVGYYRTYVLQSLHSTTGQGRLLPYLCAAITPLYHRPRSLLLPYLCCNHSTLPQAKGRATTVPMFCNRSTLPQAASVGYYRTYVLQSLHSTTGQGRLPPYLCSAITPLYHRPRSATTVLMCCNHSTLPQAQGRLLPYLCAAITPLHHRPRSATTVLMHAAITPLYHRPRSATTVLMFCNRSTLPQAKVGYYRTYVLQSLHSTTGQGRLLPYLCSAITPLYHRPRSATTVLMFCNHSTLPQAKVGYYRTYVLQSLHSTTGQGRLLPYLCAAITPLYHRPRSATTVLMCCNHSTLPQAKVGYYRTYVLQSLHSTTGQGRLLPYLCAAITPLYHRTRSATTVDGSVTGSNRWISYWIK
ncbi:hypothetical protein Btru_062049 [Bulinus truncatus]|nr:hypothetical protein Btru_062049 [Bulinus truncatus]